MSSPVSNVTIGLSFPSRQTWISEKNEYSFSIFWTQLHTDHARTSYYPYSNVWFESKCWLNHHLLKFSFTATSFLIETQIAPSSDTNHFQFPNWILHSCFFSKVRVYIRQSIVTILWNEVVSWVSGPLSVGKFSSCVRYVCVSNLTDKIIEGMHLYISRFREPAKPRFSGWFSPGLHEWCLFEKSDLPLAAPLIQPDIQRPFNIS